ncbi:MULTISPECIES: hypothetical protein [unclassified Streptomyces]|uniref:hypothetical protein n=1 Tax=unclassified Streptomyces TaxID=2593676 RepID=UPI0036FD80AE
MTTTVRLTCYATKINLNDTGCSVGPHGRCPPGGQQLLRTVREQPLGQTEFAHVVQLGDLRQQGVQADRARVALERGQQGGAVVIVLRDQRQQPGCARIAQALDFTVYEMKRLGRDAAELTALADHLTAHGLVLEMLAGPLPGIYDPTGPGKLLSCCTPCCGAGRTVSPSSRSSPT